MEQITLTIDNVQVIADSDATVLGAALANDIYIPHLCYHPDLEPAGVCRLCMVEIEGRGLTIACRTPVAEGLVVRTETEEVNKVRKAAMELLIANHHVDCLACGQDGNCAIQKTSAYIGISEERLDALRKRAATAPIDTSNPFFDRDPNKCVLCGICIRTCAELQRVSAIDFAFRGPETIVGTFANKPLAESRCESCGECVVRCPVGALLPKKTQKPAREVLTVCPYCGVGCNLYLGVRGDQLVSARGDDDCPVNKGSLCVKGRYGYKFVNNPDRLTTPLVRKNGELVEATWDEALALVAEKLSTYHGDETATLSSAKCTNEENYLIQKFSRAVMGTNNIDHCARLCHAPTVAGLVQSLGSGAMTNSIGEIAGIGCIFAIGTNTTAAHPVIGLQMKKAIARGTKLIVANPKEIDLCRFADIFLQHRPGSDVALMMGLMRVIVDEGLEDRDFIAERCENFDEFRQSLADYTPEFVTEITGVPWDDIQRAARCFVANSPGSIFYAMGITQHTHGTDNVLATSNLALLTGNVGKPSSGVNPLRGQNNVQGACDMAALPNVLPGYQKVTDKKVRKKFEAAWGVSLSPDPGLTHVEIFDAVDRGEIKAMVVVGENPMISEANSKHVAEAIEKLEFLVVQDIFLSETAQLADVVLPAGSFAEKDGTFTNTERRVQRVRKAIEPVGQARPDWKITCQIAQAMGKSGFDFADPSEIQDEIASLTPIYAGITYDRLTDVGLQWPCRTSDDAGTQFLHGETFATPSGKGNFVPLTYRPSAEVPDDQYPLILTTDRSIFHFHTGTMTRNVVGMDVLNGQELLDINPADAATLQVDNGAMVEVSSRRGTVPVRVNVTDVCPPGVVSMTFHFAETPTNVLTNSALDPVAKIPETKVCAVRIDKSAE
ncbi:MAG: formate dehydrogenase subunit alpha [Planctomycetota bacterium]|jgi:formate dehydrogenase alpha subunit